MVLRLNTSPFPEGKPRSGWVRTFIDAPHRVNGMVEFTYSLHEDQAAKDSRDDPFYYGSHIAMIRPPEIPHHRIKRTVDGKFIHVSNLEVAPEDMADFLEGDPAAYQWETKTPLLWTAPQGSLPPEMFPTYWGDPEPLDPQWPRELFVLDEAEEIDKLLARHDEGLEARQVSGDHRGTTLNLQVGTSAGDARQATTNAVSITGTSINIDATTEHGGHRFVGTIPAGATIDDTKFLIHLHADGDEPIHQIRGETQAAPVAFAAVSDNIDSRGRTTATHDWDDTQLSADGSTFWEWGSSTGGGPTSGVDISSIVQENVDALGELTALVFIYEQHTLSSTRDLECDTYDGDTSEAAKVDIEFTAAAGITSGEIMAATSPHYDLGRFGPATMVPY